MAETRTILTTLPIRKASKFFFYKENRTYMYHNNF